MKIEIKYDTETERLNFLESIKVLKQKYDSVRIGPTKKGEKHYKFYVDIK